MSEQFRVISSLIFGAKVLCALAVLLTLRSYASMIHDMLGLRDNKVALGHIKGISDDMKQAVLGYQDEFFQQHMCAMRARVQISSVTL